MNKSSHVGRSDKAVAIFKEGINCSQAVISSFAEDFGIDKNTALKLASGFGGGMGRTGHRCGAVLFLLERTDASLQIVMDGHGIIPNLVNL